jgi:hypothetical protein
MRRVILTALAVAVCGLVVSAAMAAEEKGSPTGTWTWSVERNGQTITTTLKLKADGDKLTGAVIGRNNNETKIEDGNYKNGELSFKVTRERNGQKFTQSFSGKVDGDTIKGKIEFERNGEKMSRDWEAKRSKD